MLVGTLHMTTEWRKRWWTGNKVKLQRDAQTECAFPILVPSIGHAGAALLNLRDAMTCSGLLGTDRKSGARVEYLQIVVVKNHEVEWYKSRWLQSDFAFFELPPSANEVPIGGCRQRLLQLASIVCPEDFRFCFMLDDSVQYWRGITLLDDPEPMFGDVSVGRVRHADVSLADVLLHFQDAAFADQLLRFGMVGFGSLDSGGSSKQAYSRSHVCSAVIMNLNLLNGVSYNENTSFWDELDFNLRASSPPKQVVICKCHRFAFGKKQSLAGGLVAVEMQICEEDITAPT